MEEHTIKRNTTSEIIIEKILGLIKMGNLKTGDQLPPAQKLAEQYGVGRSSVREAVRSLASMGYIAILPGKGTFIRKDLSSPEISAHGLMDALESRPLFDIMEARLAIEQKCAVLAARRATDAQKKIMQNLIQKINSPATELISISKADLEAHLLLAEATNNNVLYEIMKLLIDKVRVHADQFWGTLPKNKEEGITTITQVLSSVINGDEDGAFRHMRVHLNLVTDKLKDSVLEDNHIKPQSTPR